MRGYLVSVLRVASGASALISDSVYVACDNYQQVSVLVKAALQLDDQHVIEIQRHRSDEEIDAVGLGRYEVKRA